MKFEPDYRHLIAAVTNKRPSRLPLYEHQINNGTIARVLGEEVRKPEGGGESDYRDYFQKYCRFWKEMTYDTVSFEAGICPCLPDHGAIYGGRPGPILNRKDFEKYPFEKVPNLFWRNWEPQLKALRAAMPEGMKAVGVGAEHVPLPASVTEIEL